MASLLRMTFSGLCAYVPSTTAGRGTVLLVDATGTKLGLNRHIPRIEYLNQKYLLLHKDVEIDMTAEPAQLTPIASIVEPVPEKPAQGTNDHRDSHWIANMGALGAPSVSDDCFGDDPPKVIARVKLTAGFLSTAKLIRNRQGEDVLWHFREKKPDDDAKNVYSSAMAAEFLLTALVPSDSIVLKITPFGGATIPVPLTPTAGELIINIENSCYCEDNEGPLEDFAWYYDLAAAHGGPLHVPHRGLGGGVSDTYCPPARFAEHSLA